MQAKVAAVRLFRYPHPPLYRKYLCMLFLRRDTSITPKLNGMGPLKESEGQTSVVTHRSPFDMFTMRLIVLGYILPVHSTLENQK